MLDSLNIAAGEVLEVTCVILQSSKMADFEKNCLAVRMLRFLPVENLSDGVRVSGSTVQYDPSYVVAIGPGLLARRLRFDIPMDVSVDESGSPAGFSEEDVLSYLADGPGLPAMPSGVEAVLACKRVAAALATFSTNAERDAVGFKRLSEYAGTLSYFDANTLSNTIGKPLYSDAHAQHRDYAKAAVGMMPSVWTVSSCVAFLAEELICYQTVSRDSLTNTLSLLPLSMHEAALIEFARVADRFGLCDDLAYKTLFELPDPLWSSVFSGYDERRKADLYLKTRIDQLIVGGDTELYFQHDRLDTARACLAKGVDFFEGARGRAAFVSFARVYPADAASLCRVRHELLSCAPDSVLDLLDAELVEASDVM